MADFVCSGSTSLELYYQLKIWAKVNHSKGMGHEMIDKLAAARLCSA